jgi:hypothetical protein
VNQYVVCQRGQAHILHASVASTSAGLKEAVAAGGITCETVVAAATELALEVAMVCALATTVRTAAPNSDLESMLKLGVKARARCGRLL